MSKTVASQVFEPNQFTLQGEETQIIYSISSKIGIPQFDYQTQRSKYHFSGSAIDVLETSIGRLITVTLTSKRNQETLLTLLLPILYLPAGVIEYPMRTEMILSDRNLPQPGGPRRIEGQVQTYKTVSLTGVASLIEF